MKIDALLVAPLKLPFDVTLTMPGSKSHANRAIISSCLSKGKIVISNVTPCDDVSLLVRNLKKMKFDVDYSDRSSGELVIRGGIPKGSKKRITLNCGNAGTTLRFLTSLACVVPGEFVITGNEAMRSRPIKDLVDSLKELGADIEDTNGNPPIRIGKGRLEGGSTNLDASISSQYLTSLLLIAPVLKKGLKINIDKQIASGSYVNLTKKVLKDFGVDIRFQRNKVNVSALSRYKSPTKYKIEGDYSAAGSFYILAELTRSRLRFTNLNNTSKQGDKELPKIIKRMRRKGDITINCYNFPDQVMNLTILAIFRSGITKFTGVTNLRFKECNRIKVLVDELKKANVNIKENHGCIIIKGKSKLKSATLNPHNDHRMAFCFTILGLIKSGIKIKNPECINKSYPKFFKDIQKIYNQSKCIVIIGMRGVGKSTLARVLAKKLDLKYIDTDDQIEKIHGKIDIFVSKRGWKNFRLAEEKAISECIKPGFVVSLGGGAIESKKNRIKIKNNAIVIYLKEPLRTIINRLKKSKRPALTSLPLEQEVKEVLRRREPIYKSIADFTVKNSKNISEVASNMKKLCLL